MAILPFWNIFQRLTVPIKNYQFGRKRCQKKRKDADYKLLYLFFQKYFFVHEQSAIKISFSTHLCYASEGLFWLNLYNIIALKQQTKIGTLKQKIPNHFSS